MEQSPLMDEDQFWEIIERSRARVDRDAVRNGNEFHQAQSEQLKAILRDLSLEEIEAYDQRFEYFRSLAFRDDLWCAAFWLDGGCSEDTFMDFRACLVSLGKELYYRVLKDPDAVVELLLRDDVPNLTTGGFQYTASRVYREKTGGRIPFRHPAYELPPDSEGEKFNVSDEAEARRRLPKVYARYQRNRRARG
jgi:hypothetical protein